MNIENNDIDDDDTTGSKYQLTDQKSSTSKFSKNLIISKMACCRCRNDSLTKVEPKSFDPEISTLDESENIFTENRKSTDIFALIIILIIIGGFVFILISIGSKENFNRNVTNETDQCPNICGWIKNKKMDPKYKCDGADTRHLLENFLNHCVPKQVTDRANYIIKTLGLETFFYEISSDLKIAWRELMYLLLVILGISLGMLIAFRYIVQYVTYFVLSGTVAVSSGGTIYFWLAWHHEKTAVMIGSIKQNNSSTTSYFIYAILMSIVAIIMILVIFVLRKRIALVIQLFHEAGKAVYSMPALLLQPVYTYILIGVSFIGLWMTSLWIENTGELHANNLNQLEYKKDTLLIIARWYSIFMFFILVEFYLGCQHMIVAGAVARWFFTRNKKKLSLVVSKSTYYLFRFHLGTVAFGTLVLSIVRMLLAIVTFIQNRLNGYDNKFIKGIIWCCQCWIFLFECTLKYVTRNAYIETAIYGCDFCTGGKKAFRAISDNILREAVINSVGDFILFLGKIFVVAVTIVVGVYLIQKKSGLYHPWVTIFIAGLFAFLIAHCFISIYEMIIDTIFICFCEDCSTNDGISRPYYMSRGLMEFVENSNKVLGHLNNQSLRY
ncbi:hypothetical protein HCN44_006315 [Aphidius gifuensis]|uniref:Choline transporter-like protein n=1 Tax=Aphidius gifuensis TaxID=684658 RepID=A0A834XTM0_APHGI|nr:choline transporter-like protein 1 [Aphidius gifuensis]KAF7993255.1 hypothetical protein HCN44_006315 [Aphidius gifuensis]